MSSIHQKYGPQWREWHERKTFNESRGVWIRKIDCEIAERIMGFRWLSHNPKIDFCGYRFSAVLTPSWSDIDATYILEPDTRVPNYSVSIVDALKVVRVLGLSTIPVLPTDLEMCCWICNVALARENA